MSYFLAKTVLAHCDTYHINRSDVQESFLFRKEKKLFFSEWHEDPEYREEVNVREYPTGKILERIQGTEMTMPDGQAWILR